MPPKARSTEEKLRDKQRIIDAAIAIVRKSGLEALSIRKLSARLNMSPTNIYNYFYNKDEIYLHVLRNGFSILSEKHRQCLEGVDDPLDQLDIFLRSMISFGDEYPAYYQLMFSTQDPKALDFYGTPLEEMAKSERESALASFYTLENILRRCAGEISDDELKTLALRIVTEIHGYINLNHNYIIREMGVDQQALIDNLVAHIKEPFLRAGKNE